MSTLEKSNDHPSDLVEMNRPKTILIFLKNTEENLQCEAGLYRFYIILLTINGNQGVLIPDTHRLKKSINALNIAVFGRTL